MKIRFGRVFENISVCRLQVTASQNEILHSSVHSCASSGTSLCNSNSCAFGLALCSRSHDIIPPWMRILVTYLPESQRLKKKKVCHLLNGIMFNLQLCGVLITKLNLFVLKSPFEPIDILEQYPLIYIVSTAEEREWSSVCTRPARDTDSNKVL